MFSTLRKFVVGGDQRSIVEKYTEDLAQITSTIHDLENSLQKDQKTLNSIQFEVTYYGSGVILLLVSYLYWRNGKNNWNLTLLISLAGIGVLILLKISINQLAKILKQRRHKKLGHLKGLHQKKLEKLKEETNFNMTNSIIQRFSSGTDQSEDMMLLLNDEINDKHKELDGLKKELLELKEKETTSGNRKDIEKWYDKMLSAIAGGNELKKMIEPIKCQKCFKFFGCYRVGNTPIKYQCPECLWKLDEGISNTQPLDSNSQESTDKNLEK